MFKWELAAWVPRPGSQCIELVGILGDMTLE